MLPEPDHRFIDRRRKLVRAWPLVGTILIAAFLLLLLYLYWQSPLLVNPAEVAGRIENNTLSPSTLQLAAVMLPVLMLACFVIVLAVILFLFAAMAKERKYLDIIDRIMTHRSKHLGIFFALFLATAACSPDRETSPSDDVSPDTETTAKSAISVVRSDHSTETRYSVKIESCEIEWTVHKTEVNSGIIQHRAFCFLPFSDQIPLISRILEEILHTDEAAKEFNTLFWGRLAPGAKNAYTDMSFRLALSAAQSPLWNVHKGKPNTGHENSVVVTIANEAMIYPELKTLFSQFGKDITFSSAEKVLIMEAQELPFFSLLQKHGVNPADRLPFDCLTWFAVENS